MNISRWFLFFSIVFSIQAWGCTNEPLWVELQPDDFKSNPKGDGFEIETNFYSPTLLSYSGDPAPLRIEKIQDQAGRELPLKEFPYLRVQETTNSQAFKHFLLKKIGSNANHYFKKHNKGSQKQVLWVDFQPRELDLVDFSKKFPIKLIVSTQNKFVFLLLSINPQSIATRGRCEFKPTVKRGSGRT